MRVRATNAEGCLSVPNRHHRIKRAKRVKIEYMDMHGGKHTIKASCRLAQCIQHEIDHLNGKLFIDYLPDRDLHYAS